MKGFWGMMVMVVRHHIDMLKDDGLIYQNGLDGGIVEGGRPGQGLFQWLKWTRRMQ